MNQASVTKRGAIRCLFFRVCVGVARCGIVNGSRMGLAWARRLSLFCYYSACYPIHERLL